MLAALSTEGKILLPINKDEHKQKLTEQTMNERNGLIAAARKGDEDAIENLTLEDIDTYSLLSRRVQHEDILSIVDSVSFCLCSSLLIGSKIFPSVESAASTVPFA